MQGIFEQRHNKAAPMKRVYICHPYRNDPDENLRKVEEIVVRIGVSSARGMLCDSGKEEEEPITLASLLSGSGGFSNLVTPVSPMLAFPKNMSETGDNPITEDQGMSFCFSLLRSCDEIWIFSREISDGMAQEITAASEWGIKVVWMV